MKWKVEFDGKIAKVIDVATGENISSKLSKLVLTIEPGGGTLELTHIDWAPQVEVDCDIEVTSLTDTVHRIKRVHASS